jgi:hypothetical protein
MFAGFNAFPHYAYLKLKMPGPNGVIIVNGNTERSLRTEEQTTTFTAEVQPTEEAAREMINTLGSLKCTRAAPVDLGQPTIHPK